MSVPASFTAWCRGFLDDAKALAVELKDGGSWSVHGERLDREGEGPITIDDAIDFFEDAASELAHTHPDAAVRACITLAGSGARKRRRITLDEHDDEHDDAPEVDPIVSELRASLGAARAREDRLFELAFGGAENRLKDADKYAGSVRSLGEGLATLTTSATSTMEAATALVRDFQREQATVALAKLEHEARAELINAVIEGAPKVLPAVGGLIRRIRGGGKPKPAAGDAPGEGPASELLVIFEALSEQQLADAKRIVGAKVFGRLYDAAGTDDDAARAALDGFVLAHASRALADPEGAQVAKDELAALLGDTLSRRFVQLLRGDDDVPEADDAPDVEPELPPLPAAEPGGLVGGLRAAGWARMSDGASVAAARLLGPPLVGAVQGAAEGADEHKARVALRTLASRLGALAEQVGEAEAEGRLGEALGAVGDGEGHTVRLLERVVDEIGDGDGDPTGDGE